MATWTNLITVLNLLHNPQVVSIRMIQTECRVSRSTAYRYITAISEANFPVFNDLETGGVRLEHKWGRGLCNFTDEEASFIVAACEQSELIGDNGNEALSRSIRQKVEPFLRTESRRALQSTR